MEHHFTIFIYNSFLDQPFIMYIHKFYGKRIQGSICLPSGGADKELAEGQP